MTPEEVRLAMNKFFYNTLVLFKTHRNGYITINISFYGLVLVGMVIISFFPDVQARMLEAIDKAVLNGPFKVNMESVINGKIFMGIAFIFLFNLFIGSLLSITVPSMVIPFFGFLIGVVRPIACGFIFCPLKGQIDAKFIRVLFLLILEGQAYILALFAAYVQGRNFISPVSAGVDTHGKGYIAGLGNTLRLYVPVILTTLVAAVYEVIIIVIYKTPV